MNKIDLNGRCAVVTGGAQGFGRAIAERFVASGARVAIWDHDQRFAERTAKEIGPAVAALEVDVSDLAAVERARDGTIAALGKIDILVNNAGIAGINKTGWETDLEEWRKVLRVNLDGPFICCNAVTPAAAKTAIFDQLTQAHIDFMLSKIPKGRFVLVEGLAAMVAWLASEDCSFSSGAVFDISGGRATY